MSRKLLKIADSLVNAVIIILLCIGSLYLAYSLWDNRQVLDEAQSMQDDLLKLKPDRCASFANLKKVNEDVTAWLEINSTNIDYPVVQGKDNSEYLNKNVYKEFALAGSIFLDARNASDFSDPYSLIYGHHMAEGKMFGDLDLFTDQSFFEQNKTGKLTVEGGYYPLTVLGVMETEESDQKIFDPTVYTVPGESIYPYIKSGSKFIHSKEVQEAASKNRKVLALTTCVDESSARTVVFAGLGDFQPAVCEAGSSPDGGRG
ncbi:MAG: class B sortase [Erysipelotrichaceae bacterium]|mgnify:CR=1 FL=1|nr:class B sortase [Erysipelotrichaceae bacterium]